MTAVLATSHTDLLLPFFLENGCARGRILRLGAVVDTILSRHAYPECVSHLLAEMLCVAALLSSNLKDQGIITIQARGNGLVPMLVVDAAYGGALRGYAQISDESMEALATKENTVSPRTLLGEDSYLAITYDAGIGLERYQGVVAFEGESLSEALRAYFVQSQQIQMQILLCAARTDGMASLNSWVAGGIILERLASDGGIEKSTSTESQQEDWSTAQALFKTLSKEELLDIDLPMTDLLFRLFHESGVRITEPQVLNVHCRCSRERVHALLLSMPKEDRLAMLVEGTATVTCQFCNQSEYYSELELLGSGDKQ